MILNFICGIVTFFMIIVVWKEPEDFIDIMLCRNYNYFDTPLYILLMGAPVYIISKFLGILFGTL